MEFLLEPVVLRTFDLVCRKGMGHLARLDPEFAQSVQATRELMVRGGLEGQVAIMAVGRRYLQRYSHAITKLTAQLGNLTNQQAAEAIAVAAELEAAKHRFEALGVRMF